MIESQRRRAILVNELAMASEELVRQRRGRDAARERGDRESVRASRARIESLERDCDEMRGEISLIDAYESSPASRARRAEGREAGKRAARLSASMIDQAAAVSAALDRAKAEMSKLREIGAEAARALAAALKAHHDGDRPTWLTAAGSALPTAAGAGSVVAHAMAQRLLELIDASPCGSVVRAGYLEPNLGAFAPGPDLVESVRAAAASTKSAAATLCGEPELDVSEAA